MKRNTKLGICTQLGNSLRQCILRWLKNQFHGNPLIEQPGPYLQLVSQALGVGFLGAGIFVLLGFFGSILFIVGVLRGWF